LEHPPPPDSGSQITQLLNFSITRFLNFMSDPAHRLQQIYLAGFELKTFDRFPKCVGVVRDDCIALLVPGPEGLQMLGTPGWQIGEVMGVLTEASGRQVFQAKAEMVEATPARLEKLRQFREELQKLIQAPK
jgi:hypothetical protein